ncbi:MarC family protein [Marinilongibacter aquaticus]|uniref:MarC family protein n=1 Tax=Marinilongibacter aquaticus TaxID=2975157 RepID=UPI0021BD9F63|nr:MarC family protein [Marinilongibacter aquaticus]UBM59949.1 MarC family protein [Marinilongibacter aquaticus]
MNFDIKEILSVTLILFSIIDILGSIPIILNIRKKTGGIDAERTTLVSAALMFGYLYLGSKILALFGVDIKSFAVAGAIILLLMGFEMILGREIFKHNPTTGARSSSIVPLAFPIIAGAGTMTSLLSLKAVYAIENILVGIVINVILVYVVLRSTKILERKISPASIEVMQKVFGLILLSIAIKLIKENLFVF